MPLSTAGLGAAFAQETDQVFLILLEISHPALAAPIRVVDNQADVVSNGQTYAAYPFEIELPNDDEELPRARLRIDNVSYVDPADAAQKRVSDSIRAVVSPPDIRISIVLAAQPDTIEYGPLEMTLRDVSYDPLVVEGELGLWDDLLAEPYPGDSYLPATHPGLF